MLRLLRGVRPSASVMFVTTETNDPWPFDQPRNCTSITMRQVLERVEPILSVYHDADDHGWQFIGISEASVADGRVAALEAIVRMDPTVLEVADLPPGWQAIRCKVGGEWTRTPSDPDQDGGFPDLARDGFALEMVEQEDGPPHHPFLRTPIPSDKERYGVKPGNIVKLIFRYRDHVERNGQTFTGEHMWVLVTGSEDECLIGTIDNDPQFSHLLKAGDEIYFHPKHIVHIWRRDDGK